jgi:hypothetical protein
VSGFWVNRVVSSPQIRPGWLVADNRKERGAVVQANVFHYLTAPKRSILQAEEQKSYLFGYLFCHSPGAYPLWLNPEAEYQGSLSQCGHQKRRF